MRVALKLPVNRIGGKYFLANFLSQHIPEHTLYCEVFAGASHLLFSKSPSPVEVINDIDGYLMGFFQVIKDDAKRQKLIQTLNNMPYSRKLWQAIRMQWKENKLPEDEVERVSWWYYLNRTCFSGYQERGGFAVPSVTGRNPIVSFRNTIDNLDAVAERLRNVCIENLNYGECIQRYDSPETLFYCDPPYFDAEYYYGKGNFTVQDHYGLAGLLNGVKGRGMITHYANNLYDELYAGWNRFEYSSFKGSSKALPGAEKPRTTEVLYCNFEPKIAGLF